MPIPRLSPFEMPSLLCPTCGSKLRIVIEQMAKGEVTGAKAYCDGAKCQYGFEPTLQHCYGQDVKYVPPSGVAVAAAPFGPAPQPKTKTDMDKIGA